MLTSKFEKFSDFLKNVSNPQNREHENSNIDVLL